MLVFERKPGESFTVGAAKVTITRLKGGRVQVGVEAPREIRILRTELEPHDKGDHESQTEAGRSPVVTEDTQSKAVA